MTPFAPTTKDAYDDLLRTLVGRYAHRVMYFEVDYFLGIDAERATPCWSDESRSFDSLDFGVELHLDDGGVFSFTWGNEFTCYNLSIARANMPVSAARSWDVTDRWSTVLTGPVLEAESSWDTIGVDSDLEETPRLYPQNVTLRFAPSSVVVIAAFESGSGHLNMGAMDHITVFFDEAEARRLTGCR